MPYELLNYGQDIDGVYFLLCRPNVSCVTWFLCENQIVLPCCFLGNAHSEGLEQCQCVVLDIVGGLV